MDSTDFYIVLEHKFLAKYVFSIESFFTCIFLLLSLYRKKKKQRTKPDC